jgi:ATP-binding protein involved in chromosome partitioning
MSYFQCTKCDTKHEIFGNGGAKAEAQKLGVPFLNEIPLDISLRISSDDGNPIVQKEPNSIISQKYMEIGAQIIKTIKINEKPSLRIIQ